MAEFEVCQLEGMRWVQISIDDESVRAESGALSYMMGEVRMSARLPSVGSALKSIMSNQALVRPTYTGTGTIHLESSLHGYHLFDLDGESWILEKGAYWASEDGVQLGLHRERVWTSLRTGEGFIDYRTRVSGKGRVVLNAPGPVEEITLDDERLVAEGSYVIARTEGIDYRYRLATTFMQSLISGEPRVRDYQGTGRALVCWTPYWNEYIMRRMEQQGQQE